ncbi:MULTISPECIES: hypothetical protein [Rhodonellum]|nr:MULTISPECIES: hypothetical protein [Rhodonellum]SDY47623.1 hypothetical protein SAMN05444412_101270 [Rhodonellum ikkaensis]
MNSILVLIMLVISFNKPSIEGKWKMNRSEAFEKILTSNNFQMQDEQQQKALAETFNKILDGYYYDFRKDTVYFTDFKNYELVELKGIYWIDADTLIIGQFDKIKVQKYLISKINEKELHLKLIDPKGAVLDMRWMFKRE